MDERTRVALEGVRGGGRRRVGDRLELVDDVLVERRPPERMPAPVRGLEVRMDEAGRDRSPGDVEDGEDDPRGAARLERERGAGLELEQLLELEPARADAVARVDEVGDGGHPRLQAAGRERPVRLPDEHVRARVLLPEDLERGFYRSARRFGHEPASIGVTADGPATNFRARSPRRRRRRPGSAALSARP